MTTTPPAERVHDELWRHLDWSFWGAGMADMFREPLADTMIAAITTEQRQQANELITRWRDHREFVGRDKYEEQKAEVDRLRAELATARAAAFSEAAALISSTSLARLEGIDEDDQRPSHWERHGEWCEAADVLLAARTAPDALEGSS